MKRKFISIFAISLLILSACNNNFYDTEDESVIPTESQKVNISIKLNQTNSRTIIPQNINKEDITKLELKIKQTEEADFSSQPYVWTSVQEMEATKNIALVSNQNYDFELNLYITKNEDFILCQSAKITNTLINYSYNTLIFYPKYVFTNTGSAKITVTWQKDARISTIKAGLFTTQSGGTTEVENYELETLTSTDNDEGTKSSACYHKTNLPSGMYFIRFELYSSNDILLNTLEDIIYIMPYADTTASIPISNINTIYTVEYITGEHGTFIDDFTSVTSRNENKAVLLPTDSYFVHSDSKFAFLGWYDNPDFTGDRILSINAGTKGDKTFYARWEEITASNIIDVISMMEITRKISIKENETLSSELLNSIGNKIKNKTNLNFILDFSNTKISEIPSDCFKNCKNLLEIYLSDEISTISSDAFQNCTELYKIQLPENLESIGSTAFSGCKALTEIKLPQKLETIGYNAFKDCNELNTLYINSDINTNGCFGAPNVTKISINKTVTTINAFYGTNNIAEITLNETVPSFNQNSNLSKIKKITFNGTLTQWINNASKIVSKLSNVCELYINDKKLTDISIPEDITAIPASTFKYYISGTTITFTNSIPTISSDNDFSTISRINFNGTLEDWISNVTKITSVIPNGYDLYIADEQLTILTIPENITTIPANAFKNCTSLKEIIIPETVTSIKDGAFTGCSNIKKITVPETIPTINSAFSADMGKIDLYYNSHLSKWLTNGKNINQKIGEYDLFYISEDKFSKLTLIHTSYIPIDGTASQAFYGCTSLKEVDINSAMVDYLPYGTNISPFKNCPGITKIHIDFDVTEIGEYAFYGCKNLEEIHIGTYTDSLKIQTIPSSALDNTSNINLYCWSNLKAWNHNKFNKPFLYNLFILNQDNHYEEVTEINISESTSIAANAYENCTSLKKVTVSKNSTIGTKAFCNCQALETVNIDCNLTNSEVFSYCNKLSTITFGENVETLGDKIFVSCNSITEITLPSTIKKLGYSIFNKCNYITKATINCNIGDNSNYSQSIGVFTACTNLSKVYLGDSVTKISNYSFYANGISEIHFSSNLKQLPGSAFPSPINIYYGGTLKQWIESSYDIGTYNLFINDSPVNNIVIPNSITKISANAFKNCLSLTSVSIPSNINEIGYEAFYSCVELKNVSFASGLEKIQGYAFYGCKSLNEITLPDTLVQIGTSAFSGCTNIKELDLSDNLISIGETAFEKCKSITEITLHNKLQTIGESAFKNCENITTVNISCNITNYYSYSGDSIFYNCNKITTLNINENVSKIVYNVFAETDNPITLNYSGTITQWYSSQMLLNMKYNLYINGEKITHFEIPEGTTEINKNFINCISITSISIPLSVTKINDSAFSGFSGLTEIDLPDNLESIGASAFADCSGITKFILPETLTSIGKAAFSGCYGITEINLPDSITEIGESAFSGCKGISALSLPSKITEIKKNTFFDCENLTTITIPEGVTSIGTQAFANCTSLKKISFPASLSIIEGYAFKFCHLDNAYFPEASYSWKLTGKDCYGNNPDKSIINVSNSSNAASYLNSYPNIAGDIGSFQWEKQN